jgi:hypothetical protein
MARAMCSSSIDSTISGSRLKMLATGIVNPTPPTRSEVA